MVKLLCVDKTKNKTTYIYIGCDHIGFENNLHGCELLCDKIHQNIETIVVYVGSYTTSMQ